MTITSSNHDQIAVIAIERPERRNALNAEHWSALTAAVRAAQEDESINVLILTGNEKGHFCAGADIAEMNDALDQENWSSRNQEIIRACQSALSGGPKPIIAAIDGDAIGGGCGLAVACDIRIVSHRSRFGITPAKLGIVYSLFDSKLVADLVGPAKTKELLFTGQIISAADAHSMHLVNHVCDAPMQQAMRMAQTMNENSQHSIRNSKSIVDAIMDGQTDDNEDQLRAFKAAFNRPEFAQRVKRFMDRKSD